ncbi:eceriferum 3-like protein [Tanacetum coccineum]
MDTQKEYMLEELKKDLEDEIGCPSGNTGAPLFGWPWQNLGCYKMKDVFGIDWWVCIGSWALKVLVVGWSVGRNGMQRVFGLVSVGQCLMGMKSHRWSVNSESNPSGKKDAEDSPKIVNNDSVVVLLARVLRLRRMLWGESDLVGLFEGDCMVMFPSDDNDDAAATPVIAPEKRLLIALSLYPYTPRDNFIILQALVASMIFLIKPSLTNFPIWKLSGIFWCLIFHVGFSEPIYYWLHRLSHSSYFFQQYHWLHHSSKAIHPYTAGHATFFEHLLLIMIIGVPVMGTMLIGHGSVIMLYGYVLLFDFLRCMGHSNIEVVPHQIYDIVPLLKYLMYTPTYHFIHHKGMKTNFCLFMPLFDVFGKTMNELSWDLHKEISSCEVKTITIAKIILWVMVRVTVRFRVRLTVRLQFKMTKTTLLSKVSPVKPKKPSRCAARAKKDEPKEPPKDWIMVEETALCQAWCDVSENNIDGNSMKSKGFWDTVIRHFENETGSSKGYDSIVSKRKTGFRLKLVLFAPSSIMLKRITKVVQMISMCTIKLVQNTK